MSLAGDDRVWFNTPMSLEYSVISIGTLSHNRLWGEQAPVRTAHATTTAVFVDNRIILVDPSLPGPVLAARFNERTGKMLSDVTDVFCTTLRQAHRRGLADMPKANWWASIDELQWYRDYLTDLIDSHGRAGSEDALEAEADLKLLQRVRPAPRDFGPAAQVYPLAGPTPGTTGLLLTPATSTILIASDAAITSAHVLRGQVWEGCNDMHAALDTLSDLLEVADMIIPGHDNLMTVSRQWL
ncbi:MAG: hypothetical protein ABFD92_12575 [Planctomycetaceae bacterium]|nr:hypothetical protein [Planctomycetaceae bacterium]